MVTSIVSSGTGSERVEKPVIAAILRKEKKQTLADALQTVQQPSDNESVRDVSTML